MIVGVPQEVKNNEFRVGLTPGNVRGLCKQGPVSYTHLTLPTTPYV